MSSIPVPVSHLATLYEITRKLNSSLDLKEVLDYVMDRVIDVTGAERGFLMLRHEETGILDFRVARGINQTDLDKPRFQVSKTVVDRVVQSGQPLLTDNAQATLGEQQSVVMMALRSIMCVPIRVRARVIGLVYVDNRMTSSAFDQDHLELVTAFASQAGIAIENARLYEVAIEQGRMQRELEMAHTIQLALLPTEFRILAGYDLAFYWDSAREVAGDFYDCFLLEPEQGMVTVIADVSDKGAPAAIFMAMTRSLIRGSATSLVSAEETLRRVNHLILKDAGSSGMFVTVYYTVCQPNGEVLCLNAGHNPPLLWRNQGLVEWLPKGGRALGWFEDLPLQPYAYHLEAGDTLILYTDGLTEAVNEQGESFGEDRLAAVVMEHAPHTAPESLKTAIVEAVNLFSEGQPPFDDRTLVIVKYRGE